MHNTLENSWNCILPFLKPAKYSMSQITYLGSSPVYRGINVKVIFFVTFCLRKLY